MKTSPPVAFRSPAPAFAPVTEPVAENPGGAWGPAFWFSMAGIFIMYSRFFDLAANGLGIPRVVLSLMVLFFLMSGRVPVFLQSPAGKFLALLLAWVSVSVITGVWKGGSMPAYYQLWLSALIFAIGAGLPVLVKHVKTIMNTLALAGLVAALMSIPWGVYPQGRLTLAAGSYGDPNYYAMCLLATIPFFLAMAAASRSFVVKLFAWGAILPILLTIARSGSRGAMLGFGIMLLLLFLISAARTKFLIVAITAAGILLAAAAMPGYIRERYLTLFTADAAGPSVAEPPGQWSDVDRLHADASSAEGRRRLLFSSIRLTFEHPIFGVGPGNFATALYDESKVAGIVHNEWLATHNAYTEMSSESGLPALLLMLAMIVSGFRSLAFVWKRAQDTGEQPDPVAHATAKYLLLSMTGVCVCIFFLAVGYEFTIYLWVAMAVSLKRTFEAQAVTASVEEAPAFVPPPPLPQPTRVLPERRVPAYTGQAKTQNPAPPPRATTTTAVPNKVEGRAVRFNRFR